MIRRYINGGSLLENLHGYVSPSTTPKGSLNTTPVGPTGAPDYNNMSFGAKLRDKGITGNNIGKRLNDLTPLASNLINANRTLPRPIAPNLQSYIPERKVSLDADRTRLDRSLRTATSSIDFGTSNAAVAGAAKAAALGKVVEGNNDLAQTESNLNAQIGLRTDSINAGIEGANVGRINDFQDTITSRAIKQQDLKAENLADLFTKYGLIQRDKREGELERDKLNILERVYGDTGVVDRNLGDLIESQKKRVRFGGKIKLRY